MNKQTSFKLKRATTYNSNYEKQFNFISKGSTPDFAFCKLCKKDISIVHGGANDIRKHEKKSPHQQNVKADVDPSKISKFFPVVNSIEDNKITAAEVTHAYHIIKSHQSFNSMSCMTKMVKKCFSDSNIAKKFACSSTKTQALIKNVLAPDSVKLIVTKLQEGIFYGLSTDASNHGYLKMLPLVVNYFDKEEGLKFGLISMKNLENERSLTVSDYIFNSLIAMDIDTNNLVCFGADNTNVNFGGINRPNTDSNIFSRLNNKLNRTIEGKMILIFLCINDTNFTEYFHF